jgi:protein-arginine kinase activator protein McsA
MKSRRNKDKGSMRKLFLQQLINTIKDSEFMEGVMNELIELYSQNSDEQNELDFDETMLPDMLAVCVENEWYEVAARLHKQITKLETNVKTG